MPRVSEIMTDKLVAVEPDSSLGEVISLMRTQGCRQLPVVKDGRLIGIITDRDVRLAMNSPLTLHEREEDVEMLSSVTAESCMTSDPVTVDANASSACAAELMHNHKFGGLPVMRDGRLIGIVTVSDILANYIDVINMVGEPPVRAD